MRNDLAQQNKNLFRDFKHLRLDNKQAQDRRIIIDGPITERYFKSKPKILWVLKEAVSKMGGDSLIQQVNEDLIGRKVPCHSHWYNTWGPIIKVSNAILSKNFRIYGHHARDIKTSLEHIAVINLNKFGGYKKQSPHYQEGVVKCKNLLQKQYELLAPDITILGGTRYYLNNLLNMTIGRNDYYPNKFQFPYFIANNILYVSAYHPGQTTLKESIYFDYICDNIPR